MTQICVMFPAPIPTSIRDELCHEPLRGPFGSADVPCCRRSTLRACCRPCSTRPHKYRPCLCTFAEAHRPVGRRPAPTSTDAKFSTTRLRRVATCPAFTARPWRSRPALRARGPTITLAAHPLPSSHPLSRQQTDLDRPQHERVVERARGQVLAVGRERQRVDGAAVPRERVQALSNVGVPQAHGRVERRPAHPATIALNATRVRTRWKRQVQAGQQNVRGQHQRLGWVPFDGVDLLGVLAQVKDARVRLGVPNLRGARTPGNTTSLLANACNVGSQARPPQVPWRSCRPSRRRGRSRSDPT